MPWIAILRGLTTEHQLNGPSDDRLNRYVYWLQAVKLLGFPPRLENSEIRPLIIIVL